MSADSASILANGKPEQVGLPCTVAEFLARCGWKPTQVVVELNGQVMVRSELGRRPLAAGDRLEVIVPVAGG